MRKKNLQLRANIIREIRNFFHVQGFLEVETPLRIPANAPEEHIEPCRAGGWYLQTSPEIAMKRLLCCGYDKIFQISKCWRDGERGSRHVPEFTMLEWYRGNSDYNRLMQDCEDLLSFLADTTGCGNIITYQERPLNLRHKAERISVKEAFKSFASIEMSNAIRTGCFDQLLVTEIEPALPQDKPVMLTEYPAEMAALARLKPGDDTVAERFELYAGGLELANGFSELNDPAEQKKRFDEANLKRLQNGFPPLPLPEPFLKDLSAMPPSAGIALGIDRLVMLLADAATIDEVVAFTPEEL
jgi:lysyl-tRNA synthetase class 2